MINLIVLEVNSLGRSNCSALFIVLKIDLDKQMLQLY